MTQHKALRGWAVDLLHDGLSPPYTDQQVWKALASTALSAVNAGWTEHEWIALVQQPGKDGLWRQYAIRRGKPKNPAALRKVLATLWTNAVQYAAEHPTVGQQARDEIEDRAAAIREATTDADAALTDSERVLLRYAADLAGQVGSLVVNLPRDHTAEQTGLGRRSVETALRRLAERGVLPLKERGRRGTHRPRANAYGLPEPERLQPPYLCRVNPAGSTPAKTGSTPADQPPSTPSIPAKTGSTPSTTSEGTAMQITVTVTEEEQAEILQMLARRRGQQPDDLPDNVQPIRRDA